MNHPPRPLFFILVGFVFFLLSTTLSGQSFAHRTHVVKVGILDPLGGKLTVGYEQLIWKGLALEGKVGIIGAGAPTTREGIRPLGALGGLSVKYILLPHGSVRKKTEGVPIGGLYAKVSAQYASSTFDSVYRYPIEPIDGTPFWTIGTSEYEETDQSIALTLDMGYQFVIAKRVTLDVFAGAGYAKSYMKAVFALEPPDRDYLKLNNAPYRFTHYSWKDSGQFAFTLGFMMGVAF